MTPQDVREALRAGFGSDVSVRALRPGLYQAQFPSFLADGDVTAVYVRPENNGRFIVSDMGAIRMRLSYTRTIGTDEDDVLRGLAAVQGFDLTDGQVRTVVSRGELIGAAMGLIQVQIAAENTIDASVRRGKRAEQFRAEVEQILWDTFPGNLETHYIDQSVDPGGYYPLDAVITGLKRRVVVSVAADDAEAERAVAAKFKHEPMRALGAMWLAVPRHLGRLRRATQDRLVAEYVPLVTDFASQSSVIPGRIHELANKLFLTVALLCTEEVRPACPQRYETSGGGRGLCSLGHKLLSVRLGQQSSPPFSSAESFASISRVIGDA